MLLFRISFARFSILFITIALISCSGDNNNNTKDEKRDPLFTLLSPDDTKINFSNTLTEGLNTNVLMYEYFYNGGGVAVGDVNGDGLDDIYFTANMTSNKLYLNKGKMQFEDITEDAGVAGRSAPWKTGVTMVDINGDNKLDIFVCYSGKVNGENRIKQLFINEGTENGVPHFSDQAHRYGLADSSYTTQAVFFDFDRDSDLDLFLLNHSPNSLPILDESSTADILNKPNPMNGVRLFRNDAGKFSDITASTGLSSSSLSYGLGVAVSDINRDGWPDLYISNDYTVPDYLYINNRNGTFTDQLKNMLGQTSHFSMGNDVSDINNDGLPDIFTLDMLPEDNVRQKLLFAPDNYEKFDLNLRTGFYYQYMRNMLHINNGNGSFSEMGQLSGISNTDWSWAPLFADYDNDGWKDLYVTNGYVRDFTNMDFMKYMGDFLKNRTMMRKDIFELVQKIPSSQVKNYVYHNNGDLTFSNMRSQWGFDSSSNSNGAAYSDLDNDGDLDLIVNNINQPAFIYENHASKLKKNNYLNIKLEGAGMNTQGIGARVSIFDKNKQQVLEQAPGRGFQSSVSPILHFGLGEGENIDSLKIVWQNGKQQLIKGVKANELFVLKESDAAGAESFTSPPVALFHEITTPMEFRHVSGSINDFKRQPLLINPLSYSGPCLTSGDVNGDGKEDIYAGGGNGQSGVLYIQQSNGSFSKKQQSAFEADKLSEDADAIFVDVNKDGFPDLYVCSGGYHNYTPDDKLLQDRLYINDGKGNFSKQGSALPEMKTSKSCVRVIDINEDGFPDLFVGSRVIPGRYPETPESYLLVNDGKGNFKNRISELAPGLQKTGMITDAAVVDMNGDKKQDLVIVGEWMPITVYTITAGKLEDHTTDYFDKTYSGWWNRLITGDFNKDGKTDLVIGNLGLNSQCRATEKEPAEMYYKDFDDNGSVDPVFCFYMQGKTYPYLTRDELLDQISMMRTRFTDYKTYSSTSLTDIFSKEELEGVKQLKADCLETSYFESSASGKFTRKLLPLQTQLSPVYSIKMIDYDNDGNQDILLAGNINHPRLRLGKSDGNYGILLHGNGKGDFNYVPQTVSGFNIRGDVRSILEINGTILFGINNDKIKAYSRK